MPKRGRDVVDPLKAIAASGFIGYVEEEEEEHRADEPGVIWVEIDAIQDNPYQHAEDINPDDFTGLVESIKADGFLGALNVSPAQEDGHYFLNGGGHQRRDAARAAGLSKVPIFVSDAPTDPMVLALRVARENTARVNTSMINLGNLYQQMIDEFGWTQEAIAQAVQKDRNHVKFALTAARSPQDIQDMLRQRPESLRAMTYFRRLEHEEDRKPIMERFLAGEIATEGVRQEVEAVLERHREEALTSPVSLPMNEPVRVMPPASVQEERDLDTPQDETMQQEGPPVVQPAVVEAVLQAPISSQERHDDPARGQEPQRERIPVSPPALQQAVLYQEMDLLPPLRTILGDLQRYKQRTFDTRALTEAERRLLGEITVLTQQVLDADEFDEGV